MISGITSEETSLLEIAGKLKRQGIHQIAISMGKDGALFLLGDTPVRCPALSVKAHSPVGAGDAMVAALALAWERKFDETETIKLCMAASAGAVMTIGTKPPTAELVEELKQQVLCEKIDLRQGNCTDTDLDVKLAGCADTDVQTARSVASQSGNLSERFEFRSIGPDEAEQAAEIERICFPPNEACSRPMMLARVAKAPELFLVAVDRQTGRLAALLNGLSTNEQTFRDEFFTDADLYDPDGDTIMILGLDVLPQYRMQGLARELVRRYMERERENGRKQLLLTCLDAKVEMYQKMGFCDDGIADSSWGGEEWHQMSCSLL
jgi:ribosomal protein S18 acetylase RimI-like enzyme